MTILPSLLYSDLHQLRQRFAEAVTVSDEVHIDFADGNFVQNLLPHAREVVEIEGEAELEGHLMVQSPNEWVDILLADDRFSRIIVHAESEGDIGNLLQKIKHSDRKAGVALKPETAVSVLDDWVEWIDQVLLLFVDPGFNGSPFQPDVIDKVAEVKRKLPNAEVSADGGMRPDTLPLVFDAGVQRVAVGSYLHGRPLTSGLAELNQLVNRDRVNEAEAV